MFHLRFTQSALDDLRFLEKAEQNVVLDAIGRQLTADPLKPTRNRKPLAPNDPSEWELRVGRYRVFYDVDEPKNEVVIKTVGWKEHNKLYIRGKEYKL